MPYNPTDSRFLTVAQSRTNNGQKDIRIILDVITNEFYSLDDDGNFALIGGGGAADYTEYVAYITQTGSLPPTAVVVKNNTGFNFTFAYSSQGFYQINATGAFADKNKVVPSFNQQANQGFTSILWNNANRLDVATTDTSGVLQNDYFIGNLVIKIYN